MNQNKRTIQLVAGAIVFLLLLIGILVLPGLFKRPEKVNITMLSGELFSSTFKAHLEENGFFITNITESAFKYHSSPQLAQADCVAPGSRSAAVYFKENKPKNTAILDEYTHSRTYGVLFTREDIQLPWFLKANLVEVAPDGHYVTDKMFIILDAIINNYTWLELFEQQGLTVPASEQQDWMSLQVNINTSAPEGSSGGRSNYYLFASELAAENSGKVDTIKLSDVPRIIDGLTTIWSEQELQNTHSVHFFYEYLDKSASWPLAMSTESLYIGWWNGLTKEERAIVAKRPVVGIYPKITMSSEHTFIALTPACQEFINFVRNDDFIKSKNLQLLGFRTPGVIVDVNSMELNWKLQQDVAAIDEPKYEVTTEIDPVFKKSGK